MRRKNTLIISILLLLFISCSKKEVHFISDAQQRKDVKTDLQEKMAQLPEGHLFYIFDTELTLKEREALEFLYAYMPIGDITDYSGEYHKANIDIAFRAQEEMPWGKDIPEREFNHFVVPTRTNNENMDDFRTTYYEELKSRVQGQSLNEAILEVNHWCHEHVNYKGSDIRTSAPMATLKTSWGRCGEESTLLVTALRTVGIPARQVYTPRWAHCDDNHAWVEAWVDGGWHFLGACEPEPILDLGWFNEPASRALLLHTRVFGRYYGPEEVIERTANHTEINVVDNYGTTAKTTFQVTDTEGNPQANIPVEFKIYNYAEFCTVVTKKTDENGQTWLTAGLGHMMAFASNNGKFGFQVFRSGEADTVSIVLDHDSTQCEAFEYDIVPPAPTSVLPAVTDEMRAENNRRGAIEDSLRNAYILACQTEQQRLAEATNNDLLKDLYPKTWGNYQAIADFMAYAQEKGKERKALQLLSVLTDKDLRDITTENLIHHLDFAIDYDAFAETLTTQQYAQYILNPRVSNEMVTPYRETLTNLFTAEEKSKFAGTPTLLVNWVKDNISINEVLNVRQIPIFPTGVLKARVADSHSRDIFFVALARSIGIAAQVNPVTGKVQYYDNEWQNVDFEASEPSLTQTGFLELQYSPISAMPDPKYYTHFSIKKFNGKCFDLLAYDAKDPGIDDGMTLSAFDHPTPLEEGYYILTAGTRLSNGNALTHSEFFTIKANEVTTVDIVLREPENGVRTIGNFNAENRFYDAMTEATTSVLQVTGRNFYILGLLDQGSEPTTHAMQDISAFRQGFEDCGLKTIFIFKDQAEFAKFKLKNFNELPNNILYGCDNGQMKDELVKNLNLSDATLPIFIIANSNNEVVFVSQGYTIGLGEQLLKVAGML